MWNPEIHYNYSKKRRSTMITVLSLWRQKDCQFNRFPLELVYEIIDWL